jgi:hypothetical protein
MRSFGLWMEQSAGGRRRGVSDHQGARDEQTRDRRGTTGDRDAARDATTDQRYAERTPYNQQTRQTEDALRPVTPQQADEDDPLLTGEIPPPTTGEARWVREQTGALGSEGGNDWTNQAGTVTSAAGGGNERDLPDGDTGGSAPAGPRYEPGVVSPQPAGNQGFLEQGVEGPPNEAYGQGMTRQFAPLGAEPGIEQQEVLQSRQYEREERRSEQGMLGAVGDMLGKLFGNARRTPDEDRDRDEGEAAGEAHP